MNQFRASRNRRSSARKNRGAAVVEFAIIAPIMFLFIFGIIEFGRLVMVQQVLTNASREGARRAVLEQATSSEVANVVETYLANQSIAGATVEVLPNSLETVGFGDPVNVSVSVPFDQVSWLPAPWFLGGATMSAHSVMLGERPE